MTNQARWVAAAFPVLVCTWAWAQKSEPVQPNVVNTESKVKEIEVEEEIEDLDIEEIEDVSETLAATDSEQLTWIQIFGRMHPAAVHIPIGWILLLTLTEAFVFLTRRDSLKEIGFYLAPATLLGCLPAIVTGLVRASHLAHDPDNMVPVIEHRNITLVMASFVLVAVLLRLGRRHNFTDRTRLLYLALLIVASGLATLGGHLGGKMVFGDTYLPF